MNTHSHAHMQFKMLLVLAVAFLMFMRTSLAQESEPGRKESQYISMYQLIANGEKFNNKLVTVFAISASLMYEDRLLFADPFSYCMAFSANAVAVDASVFKAIGGNNNKSWDGDIVLVEGKYAVKGSVPLYMMSRIMIRVLTPY